MNLLAKHFTFEYIVLKHGVPPQRIPFLKKVYTDNSHSLIVLRNKLIELGLNKAEMTAILTYHGAVIAGVAIPQ
ncbi:hypothetical protein GCM10022209_46070 [Chitinophaga oryziterrae]